MPPVGFRLTLHDRHPGFGEARSALDMAATWSRSWPSGAVLNRWSIRSDAQARRPTDARICMMSVHPATRALRRADSAVGLSGHDQALVTTPTVPQPWHAGVGTPMDTARYGDIQRPRPDRCRIPRMRLDSRPSDRSGDAGC